MAVTDGIILIDKPAHMTSFGVVARIRRVLTEQNGKKTKVGHTGTLDPFATGLMILTVGKECKNSANYMKLDKVYQARIKLGQTSSTGDTEGEITEVSDRQPTQERVQEAVDSFVGTIEQTPPIYSAIKINGERAYKLARRGEQVEMPKRKVQIYSVKLLAYQYPYLEVEAHVSSGTYVRTLAQDIGERLMTGAYCEEIRRLSIGKWLVEDAVKVDDFLRQI